MLLSVSEGLLQTASGGTDMAGREAKEKAKKREKINRKELFIHNGEIY